MKTFREFLEGSVNEAKTVDIYEIGQDKTLRSKEKAELIRKAFPNNLTYQGKEFFNSIYLKEINNYAQDVLKIGKSFEEEISHGFGEDNYETVTRTISGQESYLGYIPAEDLFVSGWDMFESEDGDNIVYVKIENGKAVKNRKYGVMGDYEMMYPNGYKAVHRKYKDIIDIRLD